MDKSDLEKVNFLYKQQEVEKAFANGLADKVRNDCPEVERLHDISVAEFRTEFVEKNQPVILTGLMDHGLAKGRFDLDYFAAKCGTSEILIDLYDSSLTRMGTIEDLVKDIKNSTPDKPVYLQEWWFQEAFQSFMDDFGEVPHFQDDWGKKILGFMNHTMWIGSKGAVTPIHEDTIHFNLWVAQLFGKKEWFLFDKAACLHPDNNGNVNYDQFLEDPNTNAMSCTLQAGDILYMPHKWWHRTETHEHSASLNTPYITEDIVQPYIRGLFTVPLMIGLRHNELKAFNPMRYNVTMERIRQLANLMNFDPDYIIHAIKNKQDIDEGEHSHKSKAA